MMDYFKSIYSDTNIPSRAVKDSQCWPSEKRIAQDLSMSVSTVKRAIGDLKKYGYIRTEKRTRANGANSSLLFTILG